MDRFDPFVKYADVYGDVINWEKDPMNKPQNQNKYFFSDGKTYYEQICKMLRLMSVFKQAFNQIYDNEDEIHSAWENFVDNLSATATYGEEVGVNLTWTDTSVNFAFTIPGGQDGVGIQSITFNSDYTMTITLTDGSTYTSTSLRGPQGEQGIQGIQGPAGPQGEPGSGLEILDVYATLQDLQTAHPTGSPGDAYQVGTAPSFTLYIWSASQSGWVSAGTIGSAVPSSALPLMDGIPSAGISDLYSRGDHVHPTDTTRASTQDLETVDDKVDAVDDRVDDLNDFINTSQKLIDQSFVYRESPAEHDGLAVLDKIKGHTIKFNQLVENGNFESTSGWLSTSGITIVSASNNKLTFNSNNNNGVIYKESNLTIPKNHKFCLKLKISSTPRVQITFYSSSWQTLVLNVELTKNGEWQTGYFNGLNEIASIIYITPMISDSVNYTLENVQIFDLTAIFGSGNEPATVEEFETWLSNKLGLLPYYDYTQGSLISFNGTGLKTTGKNLLPYPYLFTTLTKVGVTMTANDDGSIKATGTNTSSVVQRFDLADITLESGTYIFDGFAPQNELYGTLRDGDTDTWIMNIGTNNTLNVTNRKNYRITLNVIANSPVDATYYPLIRFADVSDSTFEPYTESTLDLSALNTLFPTGMKDVPDNVNGRMIYDEATEKKANTRISDVDLGTLNWSYVSDWGGYPVFTVGLPNASKPSAGNIIGNIICSKYKNVSRDTLYGSTDPAIVINTAGDLIVRDSNYSSAEAFKTAMSGVMLYYELATPIEQDIDLDLSFKAYEGGTEQLLPVNGSTPTTSSLLADMTYFSINDAMDYILAKLDQVPSSITSDINSLKTRMTSAEGNITSLGGRMTTAEGNISDNASDISDLQTSLDTLEGRIDDLEADGLKVVQRTLTIGNISAGGSSQGSMAVQGETGYDMIGIIGSKTVRGTFDSNYTVETGFRVTLSGSSYYVHYKIFNLSTTSVAENVELTVDILCKKQSN